MRFSILEIFIIFWLSAFLWVLVEYFYQRINKNSKTKLDLQPFKDDQR